MTNKLDKKLDTKIIKALTRACEEAKQKVDGFAWLTHHVDYRNFPSSLMITCVFDTQINQFKATESEDFIYIQSLIIEHLARIDVSIEHPSKHVFADNEQACNQQHNGNWQSRLAAH